ncbi:MAG: hypothetical protein J6P40_02545 [Oscillospiraceae bacterium]|nr:hypothetical protein [Oscillospiraceae bacterium]
MKITINALDPASVNAAIKKLNQYAKSLDEKAKLLCERLAQMGAMYAEWNFSGVLYAGDIDYKIDVKQGEGNTYYITANGETVLLMEFGAGVTHGYGHPQAEEFGMGPGTYPGQKHAFDPNGWWFKQGDQKIHTYGNAPGMPMYNAAKDLRNEILKTAQEVFRT